MPNPEHNFEAILEQASWVQRLAYRLCADAAQAEDVTQESLLSAFREPHRKGSSLRHWLVGVVRNQARMARRSAQRRHSHEAALPPPSPPPSPEALLERVTTQRRVVQAVMELPEIYRSALLRRYFDDLSPSQIAAIDGTPEATIKTRLRRGLEMLREQLGNQLGEPSDSRSAILLLVPIAEVELRRRAAVATTSTAATTTARATSWTGGSATTCVFLSGLAVAGLLLWLGLQTPGAQVAHPTHGTSPRNVPAGPSPTASGQAATTRQPAIVAAENPASAAMQERRTVQVRTVVSDVAGNPVPGLAIEASGFARQQHAPQTVGTSQADGTCTFELEPKLSQLTAHSSKWTTAVAGTVFPYSRAAQVRIVVARRRLITGVVSDSVGAPIAGAAVTYRSRASLDSQLGQAIDRASRRRWAATSDSNGTFSLAGVPELPDASLWIEAWDHETAEVAVPDRGDAHIACKLTGLANSTSWLQGSLLLSDGSPAANAVVTLGTYAVRSDAQGRFRIQTGAGLDSKSNCLWASTAGFAPIAYARPPAGWARSGATRSETPGSGMNEHHGHELQLQFQDPLLTIAGRIVDRNGRPRADVQVDILQPSALAFLPTDEVGSYRATPIEELCLGHTMRVQTDADGRFILRGLANRAYRLVLRCQDRLGIRITDGFAAGTNQLELAMPRAEGGTPVAGVVTDQQGRALRGVPVYLRRTASSNEHSASVRTQCLTDVDGHFAFRSAMPDTARIHVSAGGTYTAIDAALSSFPTPDQLQLVLQAAGSFYLQQNAPAQPRAPSEQPDAFYLESPHGERVLLQRVEGQACFAISSGSIGASRSPVYHAPCGSHILVLLRQGVEQQRLTIDVRAGPTTRIDI